MCKKDGYVWHISPINFFEHGFYNYNFKFFNMIAKTNAYKLFEIGLLGINKCPRNVEYVKIKKAQYRKVLTQLIPRFDCVLLSIIMQKTSRSDFVTPNNTYEDMEIRRAVSGEGAWINGLNAENIKSLRFAIWGASPKCIDKVEDILHELNVRYFIDNNKELWKKTIISIPVRSPDYLLKDTVDVILLAADSVFFIQKIIKEMGLADDCFLYVI